MYNYNQAVEIFKYYSDKVIGKTINPIKAKDLLIGHIKIVELTNNTFNVYCYAQGSASVDFYRDITSVAKDLNLLSPSEVLEE